jgi:hypothetical protein
MSDNEELEMRDNDFLIRVRPFSDKHGSWNGEIDLAIISQPSNSLDDEDYFQVMHFCKMVASTVPVMEFNEDFRELVHNYVVETIDKYEEIDVEKKPEVVEQDGNVVKIDFGTTTKGNA